MGKVLYLDGRYGLSGDMLLGALSQWVEWDQVVTQLKKLPLENWLVETQEVLRGGIAARQVLFSGMESERHRHFRDIEQLLSGIDWPKPVIQSALKIFRILAEAESIVHGVPVGKVHFHEVGAVDSILDISGFAWTYHLLGSPHLYVSPLPFTEGSIQTQHGPMPLPAPATMYLLRGFKLYRPEQYPSGEAVTPTGAAVLTALEANSGFPNGQVERVAHGAGSRNPAEYPNLLRAFWVNPEHQFGSDEVVVVEATIDDQDTRVYPVVIENLLEVGAFDATVLPLVTKKGRPGYLLRVVAPIKVLEQVSQVIFTETTTLGFSFHRRQRIVLARRFVTVLVEGYPVQVKIGEDQWGQILNVAPEFADCLQVAKTLQWGVKTVLARALAEAYCQLFSADSGGNK